MMTRRFACIDCSDSHEVQDPITTECQCSCHAPISVQNAPQPSPKPGTARPTWELVVEDLDQRAATLAQLRADAVSRDQIGAAKYGIRHQHDNGRDHLVDAYQELLDGALYLRAEIEQRKKLLAELELLRAMVDIAAKMLGRQTRTDVSEVKAELLGNARDQLAFQRGNRP